MLESLQSLLSPAVPPSHPNVGEAFMIHQSLTAYYYLRSKCMVFTANAQAPELKEWWQDAYKAIDARIRQVEKVADKYGIPKPPSVPQTQELTDQLIALDGMAMVKGMITADSIALQTTSHPDIALMYTQMFNNTLLFGGRLTPILEKEGWMPHPPTYESTPLKH